MTLQEATNIIQCDKDKTTGEKLTYEEIYTRAINALGGLRAVIPYIPFTYDEIKEALQKDKDLNNLRLTTWDVAVGEITPFTYLRTTRDDIIIKTNRQLKHLCKAKRINISAAEGVSILKEAARQWVEITENKEGLV